MNTIRLRNKDRRMADIRWFLMLLLALVACTQPNPTPTPIPVTPPAERTDAAVIRRALPSAPTPAAPLSPPEETTAPAIVPPSGAIYVCMNETGGQSQQTVIEFSSSKVRELCRKYPEMGPCRYEREICRRSGGRVFAAGGTEITLATEAEYDKKVMRVRLKTN